MSDKQKLVLVISNKMDNNKKAGRNEHNLLRMPASTRKYTDAKGSMVLESSISDEVVCLEVFQAFSGDIKELRKKLRDNKITKDEFNRTAFVTTDTHNRITKGDKRIKNIWISPTIQKVVLGADPEFLLFDKKGGVISAKSVLPKAGLVGCDGAMAEVRPEPNDSPILLVKNIKDIFSNNQMTEKIQPYDWVATCYHKDNSRDYPVGGHIHVGNTTQVGFLSSQTRKGFFNSINKIMDEFLALPMIKMDHPEKGSNRRIKCAFGLPHHGNLRGYGYYGEWRPCTIKGEVHFEHRTISGMWLIHPFVAKALIGVAKLVVDEIYRYASDNNYNPAYLFNGNYKGRDLWATDFDEWDQIPIVKDMGCVKPSKEMVDLLNSCSSTFITKSYLNKWHNKLKRMASYKKYAEFVLALKETLSVNSKDLYEFNSKIKKNWVEGNKFIVEN
jgi:hypothetical protein